MAESFAVSEHLLDDVSSDPDRTVLVDFDHTLFGSNSTELFLAAARPAFMASTILWLVREFIPWYYGSPEKWFRVRDWLSVVGVAVLMPWHPIVWRWRARSFGAYFDRSPVASALRSVAADRTIIVSFGYGCIIGPLLKGSHWQSCRRLCVPLLPRIPALFQGKLVAVKKALPGLDLSRTVFISDSPHDRDLLDAVAYPHLVARAGPAFQAEERLYFPLRYTAIAKYSRYTMIDQFFFVEFVSIFLATLPASSGAVLHLVCLLLLFVSFLCVYEIGYFENDTLSAGKERAPTLTPAVERFRDFPLAPTAWTWAVVLGFPGCVIAAQTGNVGAGSVAAIAVVCAIWGAILLATRLLFRVYNRQAEEHRPMIYPFLQIAKLFSIPALMPPSAAGIALLAGQVVASWMNYVVYRRGGNKEGFPREIVRFIVFVMLCTGLLLTKPPAIAGAHGWPVVAMLGWCVWRMVHIGLKARLRRALRPALSPPRLGEEVKAA